MDYYSRGISVKSSTKRLNLNKWYHLAGTYDGKYIRIYVNGEKKGEKYVGKIKLGNTSPLYFGFMDVSGRSYYLDGVMDEVRIWSYARSEADIQTSMYCLPTGNEVGLLGYWNFDDEQNLGYDSTDSNHLILNGDASWTDVGKVGGALYLDGTQDSDFR